MVRVHTLPHSPTNSRYSATFLSFVATRCPRGNGVCFERGSICVPRRNRVRVPCTSVQATSVMLGPINPKLGSFFPLVVTFCWPSFLACSGVPLGARIHQTIKQRCQRGIDVEKQPHPSWVLTGAPMLPSLARAPLFFSPLMPSRH